MIRVTSVISPWTDFSMIRPDVLVAACERGTAVHKACECYALGLWCPALQAEWRGYFESFKKWFDLYVIDVIFTEKALKSEVLGITGHPDLCALIRGDTLPRIVDYKTPSAKYLPWRAQIAAYRRMSAEIGIETGPGMSLRLRADGGPAIADVYRDTASDWAGFDNALGIAKSVGVERLSEIVKTGDLAAVMAMSVTDQYYFANAWRYFRAV